MCVLLTARPLGWVEDFLNEDCTPEWGCRLCTYMPRSFEIAVFADLGCARMEVMKVSVSILEEELVCPTRQSQLAASSCWI